MNVQGRLQYDRKRGVIYFFDDATGACLLRIEGVPPVPEGRQIDVHLVHKGCEHHHFNCGNVGLVMKGADFDDGAICAVKIEKGR